MKKKWWKEAVGYQIYPRSFKDSNGDGIGDLNGIRQKLPYLVDLGIDFIWINPVYASPNVDNGYDISDYQEIMTDFGTMADFDLLLQEAHRLGLKVIMDLVVNHTSDQHPWFQSARSQRNSPMRDFYIWRDGLQGGPPNDWQAIFGGSAWEYDKESQQYYFHAFAKEQPDLNWENPELRKMVFEMISWWLDKGIDGFRIDAISHIKKASWTLPAVENVSAGYQNIQGIGTHLMELKQVFDRYDVMTVGEASGVSASEAVAWAGDEGYFDMIFEFEHIGLWKQEQQKAFDIPGFKQALSRWQEALDGKGWNALYMENHDVPRSVSVFGCDDETHRVVSAKALAVMYLLLQGTPFIYQGQELGMTNMTFERIDQIDALDSKHLYRELLAAGHSKEEAMQVVTGTTRDNARTPMQWDSSQYAGFSDVAPWLTINPNKDRINAAQEQQEAHSVFRWYQRLIQMRKEHPTLVYGGFEELLAHHEQLFAYLRIDEEAAFLVVVNLSAQQAVYPQPERVAELGANWVHMLGNQPEEVQLAELSVLAPYEARVYRLARGERV